MLVGIQGKMGAGKTLSASILGSYISAATNVPLSANYGLIRSERLTSMRDFWNLDGGVCVWDEIWLTLDSRLWGDNVAVSRFINQTRKKNLILIYTTQHINQVELRVRQATDILIHCERKPEGFWLNFIDYQYQQVGRRYLIDRPERFYGLYDTFEVLQPIDTRGFKSHKGGNAKVERYLKHAYTNKENFIRASATLAAGG